MQCRVPLLALRAALAAARVPTRVPAIPLVDRQRRPQTAPLQSSPALPLPSHFFLSPSHLPFWGRGVLQLKRKFPSSRWELEAYFRVEALRLPEKPCSHRCVEVHSAPGQPCSVFWTKCLTNH